mmetsp:Transcript_68346/g.124763  ORF Transcript_68346/g.124763 Transcript_68346/m.124763 type:complete len:203 (-) Transcript_68346:2-610(-)
MGVCGVCGHACAPGVCTHEELDASPSRAGSSCMTAMVGLTSGTLSRSGGAGLNERTSSETDAPSASAAEGQDEAPSRTDGTNVPRISKGCASSSTSFWMLLTTLLPVLPGCTRGAAGHVSPTSASTWCKIMLSESSDCAGGNASNCCSAPCIKMASALQSEACGTASCLRHCTSRAVQPDWPMRGNRTCERVAASLPTLEYA